MNSPLKEVDMQEIYHEMNELFHSNSTNINKDSIAQSYSFKTGRLLVGADGKIFDIDFESCTQLGCNFVDKLKSLESEELFWNDLFSTQVSDGIVSLDFNQILKENRHHEFDGVKLVSESGMQLFVKISIWAIDHGNEQFAVVLVSDAKRESYFNNMNQLVLSDSVSDYASSLIWSFKDVFKKMDTSQNRGLELLLFEMANIDVLTNLPNRKMYLRVLQQGIDESLGSGILFGTGVALIKVNHLNKVNEAHGLEHGDALLKQIALELKSILRSSDFIARFDGSTFGLALPGVNREENLPIIANRIIEHLNNCGLTEKEKHIKVSIGMTLFNSSESNLNELVNKASNAMLKASKLKTSNFKVA